MWVAIPQGMRNTALKARPRPTIIGRLKPLFREARSSAGRPLEQPLNASGYDKYVVKNLRCFCKNKLLRFRVHAITVCYAVYLLHK